MARMEPSSTPSGAIFLRDEAGGSVESLEAAFEVLSEATAERRVLVMQDATDSGIRSRKRLRQIGHQAASLFQMVVFVGPEGAKGVRGAIEGGLSEENARHFYGIEDAAEFLKGVLGPGDLVLLRGDSSIHISRLYFAMLGPVGCHRDRCGKRILCDLCPELGAVALINLPQASPSIE